MKDVCFIEKSTVTPSIFGESKFKFEMNDDVFLLDTLDSYFCKILNEIKIKINQ